MKYNYVIILFLILISGYIDVYSQKEYSNWYFGKQAGITFNTQSGEPTKLRGNSLIQYEGCAAISDYAGNLILYTNGVIVFNSQSEMINNFGDLLKGHQSSTQSAVIVKQPNSSSIYYVFTSDAGEYIDPPNEGINYSVVDMSRMGGRGEITSLNNQLLSKASEKLTTTLHANGRDIWILAKAYDNNNLYAWLLTENGITDTVITPIGHTPISKNETIGYMKVNSKGNKVAMVYSEKPFFELLNFDNKSGIFSNLIQVLVDDYYTLYGVEFSPNGNYLYISNSGSMLDFYTIFQYDIRYKDANSIAQSRVLVSKDNGSIGSLQIGPNNRIYVAVINQGFLMGIMDPDRRCPQCSFNNNAVSLGDSLSYMGLPQAVPKYSYSKNILACEFQPIQLDPEEFLDDTSKYEFSYSWTGPNSFSSNLPRPIFNPVMVNDTGTYTLNIKYIVNNDTITVNFVNRLLVSPKNNFKINGSTILCNGDEMTLQADTININFSYLWSTGARSRTLKVKNSGIYKLYITNNYGCVDSAEINISSVDKPNAEIIGARLLCNNLPIVLSAKYQSDTLTYLWSTGENVPNIVVNDPGTYKLFVKNSYGCSDSSEIRVIRIDNLKVKIGGDSVICNPNAAKLFAKIVPYDSTLIYEYSWSDGKKDSAILVNKPGKMSLKVTIEGNCVYNAEITVLKTDPPPIELNLKDTVLLCNGDLVSIEVIKPLSNIVYSWSTGEIGTKITATKSGKYTVFATNQYGCSSEKSVYIIIKDIVLLSIQTFYFTNNCNTDSIALSVYPKNSTFIYNWSNGMTGDSIIITKAGTYFITVSDKEGCFYSDKVEITLGYGINANIDGESRACVGDSILLHGTINASIPNSYQWSSGETSEYIWVTSSGKYSVKIIDNNGCEATGSKEVTFYDIPKAELNFEGVVDICQGDSIILSPLEIKNNFIYNWSDGTNSPQRTIKQSGIYKLFVSNNNQCFDSSEVQIIFHPLVKLQIKSDKDPIICDGAELELSVDLIYGINYQWSNGSTNSKIIVNQAGNYYLLYQNQYGCSDSLSFDVKSGNTKDFDLVADKIEFCSGDSIQISVSEDFAKYIWSTGETSKSIIIKKGGNYNVEVIDELNCKSQKSIAITEYNSELLIDLANGSNFQSCEYNYQDSLLIVNNSKQDYFISEILSNSNFEILNMAELIGTFKGNETRKVNFKITNTKLGSNNYKFTLLANKPCQSSKEFDIVYKLSAETKIKLDTLILESGSISCIPIYYEKICPKDYLINSGFEFTIEIPADYFNPESLSLGTIVSKEFLNGYWKLRIKVDDFTEIENNSLLLKICGVNLIGSNDKKEIKITDFKWNDSNILVTSSNGGVISSIACAINIRSIHYFRPTSINVTPNPANEKVELTINTSSIGEHKIKIYNSNAEVIEEKLFIYEEYSSYIHRILLSSQLWQNGIYFVVLESPWGVVNSKKIIVVK